jgi:7,8-dihydropterin-6-yl-methyl-4-(beta-D-ribofuranosyl)aminobenzene 5'-phosphate synthase
MPEQGLVLRTQKGLTILTGCAHPGIIKIIENVKQNISGKIYLVLCGFHLTGKHKETIKPIVNEFKHLGAERIAPTHCTGENAVKLFKEEYQKNFIEIKVGQILEV